MRKRQFKKVLSLVLALAMVFSMNTSVFATGDIPAPAVEAQTEIQPETPATSETEAPAPAEEPAAEAAPEETPAAAEEPAAEAAPEETPVAEEPAKAEEPAPAVEAEAEEPAGDAINSGDEVSGITFRFSAPSAVTRDGSNVTVSGDDVKINGTASAAVNIILSTNDTKLELGNRETPPFPDNYVKNGTDPAHVITINASKGKVKIVEDCEVNIGDVTLGSGNIAVVDLPSAGFTVVSTDSATYAFDGGEVKITSSVTKLSTKIVANPGTAVNGTQLTYDVNGAEQFTSNDPYRLVGADKKVADAAGTYDIASFPISANFYSTVSGTIDSIKLERQDAPATLTEPTPGLLKDGKVEITFKEDIGPGVKFALSAPDATVPLDYSKTVAVDGKKATISCENAGKYYIYYRTEAGEGKFPSEAKKTAEVTIAEPVAYNWQDYTGGKLEVTNGKILEDKTDKTKILISADKTGDVDNILSSTGDVDLKRIVVSDASVQTVKLSGNGISVNDVNVGQWNDASGIDDSLQNLTLAYKSVIYNEDGTFAVANATDPYAENTHVYKAVEMTAGKEYSLSLDKVKISFNKAGTVVSVGSVPTAKEVQANTEYGIDEIGADFVNTAKNGLFIQFADGSIGYNSDADIPGYANPTPYNAVTNATPSKNGVALGSTLTTHQYAISGNNGIITEWKQGKTGDLVFNNIGGELEDFWVIARTGGTINGLNTEFVAQGYDPITSKFKTTAEIPASSEWSYSPDWYAVDKNGDRSDVSQNKAGSILIPKELNSKFPVIIAPSSNNAKEINKVYLSGDSIVGDEIVTLSANKTGISINNASVVSVKTGVPLASNVQTKDDYVLDRDNKINYVAPGAVLKNGDVVYEPETLELNKHYSLSLDMVQMTLSDNVADGVIVYAGGNLDAKDVIALKADNKTPADIDNLVGKNTIIIAHIAGESGFTFSYIANFPNYQTPGFVVPDASDFKPDYFEYSVTADNKYYETSTSVDNLSELKAKFATIKAETSTKTKKVVSTNDGAYLTANTTYYVYGWTKAGTGTFAKFTDPMSVKTGLSENFTVYPKDKDSRAYIVGDKITYKSLSWDVVAGQKFDGEELTSALLAQKTSINSKITGYSLSSDASFNPAINLSSSTPDKEEAFVKAGSHKISLNGINSKENLAVARTDSKIHDWITVTVENGTVPVADKDTEIKVVLPDYYYGLDVDTFLSKATATVGGETIDATTLFAKFGKTVSGTDVKDELTKDQVKARTVSDGSFAVKFFIKENVAPSTNAASVSINKTPVRIGLKTNYFSLQGTTAKAEAVAQADVDKYLYETEFYGTVFEKHTLAKDGKFVDTTKAVTPKFDTVKVGKIGDDTDLATLKDGQDYGLTYTAKIAASANYTVEAGNFIETTGNKDEFYYNVAPVYNVKFAGDFQKVTVDGLSGNKPGMISVNSAAAKAFIKGEYADYAHVVIPAAKFDVNTNFTVPKASDVTVNPGSIFDGWLRNGKLVPETEIQKISDNKAVYDAKVKKGVPGFTNSENALMISLTNDIEYTGLKHVSDPAEQIAEASSRAGAGTAIEKTRQLAMKNSGDVKLSVYVGKTLLVENYDYKTTYKNNINAYVRTDSNKADWNKLAPQVEIKFMGGYAQYPNVTEYFDIQPADIEGGVVDGSGLESRIIIANKNKTTVDKIFTKTDLVNKYTGKTLSVKYGKNQSKSDLIIAQPDTNFQTEGWVDMVINGNGNYTGTINTSVYVSTAKKITWSTINVAAKDAKFGDAKAEVEFTNTDSLADNETALREDLIAKIKADTKKGGVDIDDSMLYLYKVKGDYSVPGTKKVNYKAYYIDETATPATIKGIKGSYSYVVKKISDLTAFTVTWSKPQNATEEADGTIVVPYTKGGATLPVEVTFNGNGEDATRLFKIAFKNNKNPGKANNKKASATLAAQAAAYFDSKATRDAFKADPFVKQFYVDQAVLEDVVNVRYAYIADADGTDAKKVKAANSIVLTDEMGTVLKNGSDYEFGTITGTKADGYKVQLKAKGKNYKDGENKFEIDATGVDFFLGNAVIALNSSKIKVDDIASLENGDAKANSDFGSKYVKSLKIGKEDISKKQIKETTSGNQINNFNYVVTKPAKGGKCYVQVVGVDGGVYGGSDVLGKKAVNKATE